MFRTRFLAMAAVAAFGITALAASDASARFGGGGGGGGFGHANGHVASVNRVAYHPGGNTMMRRQTSNYRPVVNHPPKISHAKIIPNVHPHKHPPYWAFKWCHHHHHHHWCQDWGIDWVGVEVEPIVVAAATPVTRVGAVCTDGCDYLLNDGTGCYMAKRKFSTPQGVELRCVKLCGEPEVVEPEVK